MSLFRKRSFNIDRFIKKAQKYDPFEVAAYEELISFLKKDIKQVYKKKLGLKLIVISDTHCELTFHKDEFVAFVDNILEYDLCIILGDIHPREIDIILGSIPREKIIAVKGNHDSNDQYRLKGVREISGQTIVYKGIGITGLEGSFKYKKERFPSFSQYESLLIGKRIIDSKYNTEILVSHDLMFQSALGNFAHIGLVGLSYIIFNSDIQYHFHGHIHKSYSAEHENGTIEKSVYLYEYFEI